MGNGARGRDLIGSYTSLLVPTDAYMAGLQVPIKKLYVYMCIQHLKRSVRLVILYSKIEVCLGSIVSRDSLFVKTS